MNQPPTTPSPSQAPSARQPISLLVQPFYLLRFGHLPMLLYIGLLGTLGIYGIGIVHKYAQSALTLPLVQFNISVQAGAEWRLAASLIIWVFLAPLLITATALPARIIWLHNRLTLEPLITETATSLLYCVLSLYLSIRRTIYYLAPAGALVIVYYSYIKQHQVTLEAQQFYLLASAAVGIMILFKIVPTFAAVLVSVCGQNNPFNALQIAPEVYRGQIIKLFLIIVAAVGISAGIHFGWHGGRWTPQMITWTECGIYLGILWYTLTILSVITLRRLTEMTTGR